jgi:hypothetical protein
MKKTSNYKDLIEWNQGWNCKDLKVNGQLRVKLYKSEANDQIEKKTQI